MTPVPSCRFSVRRPSSSAPWVAYETQPASCWARRARFSKVELPVQARLDVLVFNRAVRAAAWSELMGREMDIRDPENGLPQSRLSGPDEADGVWVVRPVGGGIATVVGHRGTVGFVLQVTVLGAIPGPSQADPEHIAELSARAEVIARQAAADWSGWLAQREANS